MNLKPFQAVFPKMDFITSADHFFSTVKEQYPEYIESGFFEKSPQEGFYVYQIQQGERKFTGLVAGVDIHDYIDGRILKHEKTLSTKEQQQIHLILKRHAQVKPILLTYPKNEHISKLLKSQIDTKKPSIQIFFEQLNEKHSFWAIREGKMIEEIQQLFKKEVPQSYIADGHHRTSATALMYQRMKGKPTEKSFNKILCAFFETTELEILDFNRVIEGLNEVSPTYFMARISQLFEIEPLTTPIKPTKKHEITLYINKEWYKLTWKKEVLDSHQNEGVILDVSLLNELVLRDILGIQDVRMDLRVKYVEGPKGLEGLKGKALKNDQRIGFCLYPVNISDFIKISDHGKTLPPKSTWFEPRIKNGLIVKEF
ncbi:MAG: DUF1015 family protein [Saprospiraceae bacterium]|nr:DUF1015 family protein [Saprospiraceae bacterium]